MARASTSLRGLPVDLASRLGQQFAAEPSLQGFIADGRVQAPSDAGALPSPPAWLERLSGDEAARWHTAEAAVVQRDDSVAARTPLNNLRYFGSSPSIRANAELALLALDHPFDAVAFVDLARRYPGILTDSGAPLAAIALLYALRAVPKGPLPNGFMPELTRQVHSSPSFLTAQVLEEAERIPNLSNIADVHRLHDEWNTWRDTVDALRALLRRWPPHGAPFQRWTPDHRYLALGTPFPGGCKVNLFARDAAIRLFLRAYAAVHATLAINAASLTMNIAGEPLTLAGSPKSAFKRQLTLAQASSTFAYSAPVPFTLTVDIDESMLYSGYRSRLWLMTALILCAATASLLGLASLWRGYQRQGRLSELKSNFVSSVSHELRAPLGAVRLMAENLERGKVPDPGQQKEYFHLIGQECRRLASLVENVLDFSRMESGGKQYTFEPVDLVPLLQHTIAIMETIAAERGVTLCFTPPADPPQPCWDAAAIEQAIINLLDNAIKHSPCGAAVTLEVEPAEDHLRIWIKDTGPGVPSADQSRIFELFYRRGSELRRETPGAGIGLSIVKHVAEAHGGRVLLVSEIGRGSHFALDLPCRSAHG